MMLNMEQCKFSGMVLFCLVSAVTFVEAQRGGHPARQRLNIPVLANSVRIGQLYDAKRDVVILGKTLFLDHQHFNSSILSNRYKGTFEQDLNTRMEKLDIKAELEMSFLAGLITVKGSAAYLDDRSETTNEAKVVFEYKRRSVQSELDSSKDLEINQDICKDPKGATHVVTQVQYGFNVYMSFRKKVTDATKKNNIKGELEVAVKSIPGFSITGSGSVDIDEETENLVQGTEVNYYGDLDLPIPSTFEQAVLAFNAIEDQRGDEQNSKVVSFSISPISDFCGTDAQSILYDINRGNILKVSKMMADMESTKSYLEYLKETDFAKNFGDYQLLLVDLERRFAEFENGIKLKLQYVLPKVRSGVENQAKLTEIVKEYEDSVFKTDKFEELLRTRQKEIETVEAIIYHKELMTRNSNQQHDSIVIDYDGTGAGSRCVLNHRFTMTYQLEVLPDDPLRLGETYEQQGFLDESGKWFKDPIVAGQNRPLVEDFVSFFKNNKDGDVCFLISLKPLTKSSTNPFQMKLIHHLRGNQRLEVDNFRPPIQLVHFSNKKEGWNNYEIIVNHPSYENSQLRYELKATASNKDNPLEVQSISTEELKLNSRSTAITIQDLLPFSDYSVELEVALYYGNIFIGMSEKSEPYHIFTLPQPPQDLKCTILSETELQFSWSMVQTRNAENISNYKFTLNDESRIPRSPSSQTMIKEGNTRDLSTTFGGLLPNTPYHFEVKYSDQKIYRYQFGEKFRYLKIEGKEAMMTCETQGQQYCRAGDLRAQSHSEKVNWQCFINSQLVTSQDRNCLDCGMECIDTNSPRDKVTWCCMTGEVGDIPKCII